MPADVKRSKDEEPEEEEPESPETAEADSSSPTAAGGDA